MIMSRLHVGSYSSRVLSISANLISVGLIKLIIMSVEPILAT